MDQSEELLEDMTLQKLRQVNVRVQVLSSAWAHGRMGVLAGMMMLLDTPWLMSFMWLPSFHSPMMYHCCLIY